MIFSSVISNPSPCEHDDPDYPALDLMSDVIVRPSYLGDPNASDEIVAPDFGGGNNAEGYLISPDLPEAFLELLEPARYKVFYGGRGSAKSWSFARVLVMLAVSCYKRILCCREYQSSIAESVHYVIVDQINQMGLNPWFVITDKTIYCPSTGSEFIFKGLRLHIHEIKSTEGVDICWIEEGQAVSRQSFNTLDPTIRSLGSEIWISYNPLKDEDCVHDLFVVKGVPEYDEDGNRYAIVRRVNYTENPYFPDALETLRLRHLNEDQDVYAHIWQGETLKISDAMIFKGKWEVRSFETPEDARFYFGADWGFAQDPTVLIRSFIVDECLYIDHEVYAREVELDYLPPFFAGDDTSGANRWANPIGFPGIPGASTWPIKGDNSRPETISYLARYGLNVTAAEKWKGSVEDGIAHLRGFRKIVIHTRCPETAKEALLYRYKVDKNTEVVLPIVVDAHNHCWDAIRYSLDGFIQQRGEMGMWARLGREAGG